MDWPNPLLEPLICITPWHSESYGYNLTALSTGSPSSGNVTANQAYCYPFHLDVGSVAKKIAIMNGSGTITGDIDVGIYDAEFNLLVSSGSTPHSGALQIQEFDIADTALPPGDYWMAVACSSSTTTVYRLSTSRNTALGNAAFYVQQTGAFPLPATLTPQLDTSATLYVVAMGVWFDPLV
jgi:hypothetical protein